MITTCWQFVNKSGTAVVNTSQYCLLQQSFSKLRAAWQQFVWFPACSSTVVEKCDCIALTLPKQYVGNRHANSDLIDGQMMMGCWLQIVDLLMLLDAEHQFLELYEELQLLVGKQRRNYSPPFYFVSWMSQRYNTWIIISMIKFAIRINKIRW